MIFFVTFQCFGLAVVPNTKCPADLQSFIVLSKNNVPGQSSKNDNYNHHCGQYYNYYVHVNSFSFHLVLPGQLLCIASQFEQI
ncbi:hypothetical protein DERF_011921 [Dermatophagoides farinae]|uniref:Uncharacterized protein n=1 Tax=Dermatophagoides farinae TaxID=6954 RepID=A0A922HQY7_DERFA|nr:hypothetical protein DERF_011921 [Dermatophagoides farinae]